MKRLLLSCTLSLTVLSGICQTKKIDGIVYEVISPTKVAVKDARKSTKNQTITIVQQKSYSMGRENIRINPSPRLFVSPPDIEPVLIINL